MREVEGACEKHESMETVLITGATGFLGEYLVRRLVGEYRVLALGRNREKGRRLEGFGAEFCSGDFTDWKSCAAYFQGVQYVIHAGALSTVWGKWEDFYKTNVMGTDMVAELCHKYGIKRMVYISSPSIYTQRKDRYHIREDQAPSKNKLNDYIKSKLMAERKIMRWSERGLETVILRPRGLIGIGDSSLVPRLLCANARTGIPLFNGGRNLVDLTSVENVALACRLAMTAEGAAGEIFNITNGEPAEFRVLLEQFLSAIGERPRYKKLPFGLMYAVAAAMERLYRMLGHLEEPPLTRYTICTLGFAQTMDISHARRILGYRPEKTLAESIREYGTWWKAANDETDTSTQSAAVSRRGAQIDGKRKPKDKPSVIQVTLYHCGFCSNNLGLMFRDRTWEKREFPAAVALIRHRSLGNILYDTGYSEQIFKGGIFLKLYRMMNPVCLKPGQTISERLMEDGIHPESIKTIILSHAHPDHVGGLSQFSGYELVASGEVLKALEKPGLGLLMCRNLLPKEGCIGRRRQPEKRLTSHFLCRYFQQVYDLFGDGSVIGVRLDGHCEGQLGVWIPDVSLFLAADACWGRDLVRSTPHMRLVSRLIQKDYAVYKNTLRRLCMLKRDYPEIEIVFTHQKGKERGYD